MLVFKSVLAKDVMTPFSVALTVEEDTSIRDFISTHKNLKFSRIPIYKTTPNNITGFVLKDEILEHMIEEKGEDTLAELKKEVLIAHYQTPIPKLFELFIDKKSHLAMVTDEFGNTVGLITMEDIIETLLGLEIMDESDNIEDMQLLARKNWEKRAKQMGLFTGEKDEQNKS